ncbi:MAG TPA: EAL domain-containing protein, partial [Acidimicrobiales bacterium]
EVYEAGMHAAVVERMALKSDLRRGVAEGEFIAHYQPIVDLATGAVRGVEALARWTHPERGILAPAAFLALAEETGLIVDIGRMVMRQACSDLARWRKELGDAAPATLSVNLSGRELLRAGLVDEVGSMLKRWDLPPSSLVIEITETMLMEDTDAASRALVALKALGVQLALDDFGTGYSSLSYLDRFPVDFLKIDKSFVQAMADGEMAHPQLVEAIIGLGSMLGLKVTAEGIELPGQLDKLRTMGCAYGQGYFFARPVAAADLELTLRAPALTTS